MNMHKFRRYRTNLLIFLALVGPGIITANVDNDAGGIYTLSVAGARYGYGMLWTLIPITVALLVVQEMVARIGVGFGDAGFSAPTASLTSDHFPPLRRASVMALIMLGTPAIRNLIRENKIAQMYSAIQTGAQLGMQTLDQNLQEMVKRNLVSPGEARGKAQNKDIFPG